MPTIPSITHRSSTTAAEPTQEVSWQTLYWALFTLALNTYLQSPYRVYRLSPIFAVLDALELLTRLAAGLLFRLPLQHALQLLLSPPQPVEDDIPPDPLAGWHNDQANEADPQAPRPRLTGEMINAVLARREAIAARDERSAALPPVYPEYEGGPYRWWVRLLLGFGALVQLVKLFGLKGVPWARAWGGLYFGAYVVREILDWMHATGKGKEYVVLSAEDGEVKVKRVWERMDEWVWWVQFAGFGALYEVGVWVFMNTQDEDGVLLQQRQWARLNVEGLFGMAIVMLFCVHLLIFAGILVGLEKLFKFKAPSYAIWVCFFFALVSWGPWYYYGLLALSGNDDPSIPVEERKGGVTMVVEYADSGRWLTSSIMVFWQLVAALVSGTILRAFVPVRHKVGWGFEQPRQWEVLFTFVFTVTTFGLALFYYARVYDPSGTEKPAWTENLG